MPRLSAIVRCAGAAALALGLVIPASAQAAAPSSGASDARTQASGTPLSPDVGLYPRLIRLAHTGADNGTILASVVTFDGNNGLGAIYESRDEGETFTRVGTVADPESAGGKGLCCASLYELPRQVGDMPAGTLLWASDAGQDSGAERRMTIRIWRSADRGRTWSLLATPAVAANDKGMWEPEIQLSGDRLVVVWADETDQPAHSQMLVQSTSTDGVNWTPRTRVVASTDPALRPGMPVIRQLPDGTYLMTYEICGPGQGCSVHYRTSADGVGWGDPAALGPQIKAEDGRYFTHTPNTALTSGTTPGGRLYLTGQLLMKPDGTIDEAGNGRTVMVSDDGPGGPWRIIPAPVSVPNAYDNYCPNYSSALLTTHDDSRLLGIATDDDTDDVCKAYYATGPTN